MRKSSFLVFLSLVILSFIFSGCKSEATVAEGDRIVATQDESNLYKFSFKVIYNGAELTSRDGSFTWDFGDSYGSSTQANPEYEYVEDATRNVTVKISLNKDADGAYKTISLNTTVTAGSPDEVYDTVIYAYPGTGRDLLDYQLVSSTVAEDETLHYMWVITDPNGVVHYYGRNEDLTSNVLNPHDSEFIRINAEERPLGEIFQYYNSTYYVDLYIRTDSMSSFPETANATLMLQTAIPEFSIDCAYDYTSTGTDEYYNTITCTPVFDYDIEDNTTYSWKFYSIDGDEMSADTNETITTHGSVNDGAYSYNFYEAGTKQIVAIASNEMVNGELRATRTIAVAEGGYLSDVTCERPTNVVGAYADNTALYYVCQATGYYVNNNAGGNIIKPLTEYTWSINGVDEYNEYSESYGGYEYKCSNRSSTCSNFSEGPVAGSITDITHTLEEVDGLYVSTISFYAPEYNDSVQVSVSGRLWEPDSVRGRDETLDDVGPDEISIPLPSVVRFEATQSSENTVSEWDITPIFGFSDTGEEIDPSRLFTDTNVTYNWTITETRDSTSSTCVSDYNGTWNAGTCTLNVTTATVGPLETYKFNNSGYYTVWLTVDENNDSGVLNNEDVETVISARQIININLDFSGSDFYFTIDNATGQLRFTTNIVALEDGKPVDTIYEYCITGPTYRNAYSSYQTTRVIVGDNGKYETNEPTDPSGNLGIGSYQALFGGTYSVRLRAYNTNYYDVSGFSQRNGNIYVGNNCNSSGALDSVAGATYLEVEYTNKKISDLGVSWKSVGPYTNAFAQTDLFINASDYMDDINSAGGSATVSSTMVNRSLFTCRWTMVSNNTNEACDITFGAYGQMETGTYVGEDEEVVLDCGQPIMVDAQACATVYNPTMKLEIVGPWFYSDGGLTKWTTDTAEIGSANDIVELSGGSTESINAEDIANGTW